MRPFFGDTLSKEVGNGKYCPISLETIIDTLGDAGPMHRDVEIKRKGNELGSELIFYMKYLHNESAVNAYNKLKALGINVELTNENEIYLRETFKPNQIDEILGK